MNKNEYLGRLNGALKNIPPEERAKSLAYFSEAIDDRMEDGVCEEAAVAELENVQSAARRIIAEAGPQYAKARRSPWLVFGITAFCLVLAGLIIYYFVQLDQAIKAGRNSSDNPIHSEVGGANNSAEKVVKSFEDNGQDIDISVIAPGVNILPSDDGKIHLSYTNYPDAWFELEETDGKITLIEKQDNVFNIGGLFSGSRSDIELRLPSGGDRAVLVSTVSGSCDIKKLSTTGRLEFDTVSGGFDAENCDFGEMILDSTSGSAEIHSVSFDRLSFSTVSGDLDGGLLGTSRDYSVRFDSISGGNDLAHCKDGDKIIEFDSVSGSLDLEFSSDFDD